MLINRIPELTKRDKDLVLPRKLDALLAELIGIHLGDGSIGVWNHTYRISYSFDSRHVEYINYVQKLLFQLFGAIFRKQYDLKKHSATLYYNSKTLFTYFVHALQLPNGRKTNLRIPNYLLHNNRFISAFLKGVFDTDGCTTHQRDKGYVYTLLKFSTKHLSFAEDIKYALSILNIKSFICTKSSRKHIGYDVVIRNKESIKTFLEIIKPVNKKK